MSEYDVHKNIVKHLRWRGNPHAIPIHIHNNPNSGQHGKRLNSMGLVAGVPDMLYILRCGLVLWHEIKTEGGRLSSPQKAFHKQLEDFDHTVLVTYGLDDALGQLTEEGIIK